MTHHCKSCGDGRYVFGALTECYWCRTSKEERAVKIQEGIERVQKGEKPEYEKLDDFERERRRLHKYRRRLA